MALRAPAGEADKYQMLGFSHKSKLLNISAVVDALKKIEGPTLKVNGRHCQKL